MIERYKLYKMLDQHHTEILKVRVLHRTQTHSVCLCVLEKMNRALEF